MYTCQSQVIRWNENYFLKYEYVHMSKSKYPNFARHTKITLVNMF